MTYASETRTVIERRLEAAEKFLRTMFRISWTSHTTTDNILFKADTRQNYESPLGKHNYSSLVVLWENKKWKSCLLPEKIGQWGTEYNG